MILMYTYHLCIQYIELSLEMSGWLKGQIMNCLIKYISKFDWSFLHQVSVIWSYFIIYNIFIEFAKLWIPSKTIVVQEDDKPWNHSKIRRNSRKRNGLKKKAIQSGNPNVWNKYEFFRNKVKNKKKTCEGIIL